MIQFFVSSTFRDMHYERDIINSVILPQQSAEVLEDRTTVMN